MGPVLHADAHANPFTQPTALMAQGALKLNSNGSVGQQTNAAVIAYSDDEETDCCCGDGTCEVHYLYQCDVDDPDGTPPARTTKYITHEAYRLGFFGPYIVNHDNICYVVGPCEPNGGGTDVSSSAINEIGTITCSACVTPPVVFNCVPDLAEDYTDAEIEAMYPDLVAMFVGVGFCPTYTDSVGFSHYNDTSFNMHPILLTASPLIRNGDGHSRDYTYENTNDPNDGLFGDAPITGCTHFVTDGPCNPGDDSYNYNVDHITVGLSCVHDHLYEPTDHYEDVWKGGSSAQADAIRTTCFAVNAGVQFFDWNFGVQGLIDTLGNDKLDFHGDCSTEPRLDAPCGLGSMLTFAVPPGLP